MSRIRIKNFGPIKEGFLEEEGWMDIKKVTLFIGNQGSGKSTVVKLISTLVWIEKALTRGDFSVEYFKGKDVFKKYLNYHRIENYFNFPKTKDNEVLRLYDHSEIDFEGINYSISYSKRHLIIKQLSGDYELPQIMYMPADRNFLSSVADLKSQRLFSEPLREVLVELQKAKEDIVGDLKLPINDANLEYDKFKDTLLVNGDDYSVSLPEASSGFQSLVPLYLVSWFLANAIRNKLNTAEPMSSDEQERFRKELIAIQNNPTFTDEQKRIARSVLPNSFNKKVFINIVEEPEQNLFPESQWEMLKSLLAFNNYNDGNKLILTTHSPYIINYLTLAIQAGILYAKVDGNEKLESKLAEIVPAESTVKPEEVIVYQLNDKGSIERLADYEGLPSDRNYLNQTLEKGNLFFDALLEIEEQI